MIMMMIHASIEYIAIIHKALTSEVLSRNKKTHELWGLPSFHSNESLN